mmetsp:Transcript_49893/g.89685  ORF Transcript_49893/g.89685 Transcript_49893/m.89685 type:complete len:230 (+) Transcript_49893:548-1237(+)
MVVDPVRMDLGCHPLHEVVPHVAPHRVCHHHCLDPIHRHQSLDLLAQSGEVAVAPLHVCEGEPPVVGRHVHGVQVIPDVRKSLYHQSPKPVSTQEEVSTFEPLRRPNSNAAVEVRTLQGIQTSGRIEREVTNPAVWIPHDGLKHGRRAPNPLSEVAFDALLSIPNFQAGGDDAGYHHHRTLHGDALPSHANSYAFTFPQDLTHVRHLPSAEELLDTEGRPVGHEVAEPE